MLSDKIEYENLIRKWVIDTQGVKVKKEPTYSPVNPYSNNLKRKAGEFDDEEENLNNSSKKKKFEQIIDLTLDSDDEWIYDKAFENEMKKHYVFNWK